MKRFIGAVAPLLALGLIGFSPPARAQGAGVQNWSVGIHTSSDQTFAAKDDDELIGVMPGASDGYVPGEDIRDAGVPGSNYAAAFFVHYPTDPGFANHAGDYSQDIRAPLALNETKIWDRLNVQSDLGTTGHPANITVDWGDLSAISPELQFTFNEEDVSGKVIATHDMRAQPSFSFPVVANGVPVTRLFSITVHDTGVVVPQLQFSTGATATPVITGSPGSVMITFATNTAAVGSVDFGPTSAYGSTLTESMAQTSHALEIMGLTPGATYHFRVNATGSGQTIHAADATFTVGQSLTFIDAPNVAQATDPTATSAFVAFTTSAPTTTTVDYGPTAAYGQTATDANAMPDTAHAVELTGLTQGTTYHYRVTATAADGSQVVSPDATFAFGVTSSLAFTGMPMVLVTSMTGATLEVGTNLLSAVTVTYGTSDMTLNSLAMDNTLNQTHTLNLVGLQSDTAYVARITAVGADGMPTISTEVNFNTSSFIPPPPPPPGGITVTFVVQPSVAQPATSTATSAFVTFSTNVATTVSLDYGATTTYGHTATDANTIPDTGHAVDLTGLTQGATYHYRVTATASDGSLLISPDATFTFGVANPLAFSATPSVSAITTTGATVTVSTNLPSAVTATLPSVTGANGIVTDSMPALTHALTLVGLQPGTAYTARVSAVGAQGMPTITADVLFTTAPPPVPTLAFTSGPQALVAPIAQDNEGVITWTTSLPTTGEVDFGATTSYGGVAFDNTAGLSHFISLIGLTPGQTYHYRVIATGATGAAITSADATFTVPTAMTPVTHPTGTPVPGDLSGDRQVSEVDAIIALRIAAGLEQATPAQLAAGELVPFGHPDPRITVNDATVILRMAFGLPVTG